MSIWAIGDIHGQAQMLDALLSCLPLQAADTVVFLGDLIDRGPNSAGVLAIVRRLQQARPVIYLRGNHEAMALKARQNRSSLPFWQSCGGEMTLDSYNATSFDYIPDSDWELVESSQLYYETDGEIYIHANLDPDLPMEAQSESDLLWRFLHDTPAHHSGKFIVCGHTEQESGLPKLWRKGICIDTLQADGRGWLTAVNVERRAFWQVDHQGDCRSDTFVTLSIL